MNNKLQTVNTAIECTEAIKLHNKIMTSAQMALYYLCELGASLKEMRDKKLYIDFGYETFDEYTREKVGFKGRQAYTYISTYEELGSTVMKENSSLGITKLALLTKVPGVDRAEFIENNDLKNMSVEEIENLIKQSKEQVEQIALFTQQSAEKDEALAEAEAKLEELQSRPIDVAVAEPSQADFDKIRLEIEAEVKKTAKKEQKQAVEDAKAKALAEADKKHQEQLEQIRIAAEQQAAEKLQKELEAAETEKANLLAQSQELAKKLKLNGNTNIVTISILFNNMQDNFGKIIAELEKLSQTDAETKAKLQKNIMNYVDKIIQVLTEI